MGVWVVHSVDFVHGSSVDDITRLREDVDGFRRAPGPGISRSQGAEGDGVVRIDGDVGDDFAHATFDTK